MEMFMSFAILHGVQFYVYLTLGDANIENTNLTQHSKGQPSHTYPKRREFIEIIKERQENLSFILFSWLILARVCGKTLAKFHTYSILKAEEHHLDLTDAVAVEVQL